LLSELKSTIIVPASRPAHEIFEILNMMWMIRNPGGQYAQDLRDKGVVGIGWSDATPNVKGANKTALSSSSRRFHPRMVPA
jgi:hypothetical protein